MEDKWTKCLSRGLRRRVKKMHIGHIIRQKAEEKGIPIVRLARELSYSRTNMYKIFSKKSIDTDVLVRLSNILDFDFFGLYSKHLDKMKKCCSPDGARTR